MEYSCITQETYMANMIFFIMLALLGWLLSIVWAIKYRKLKEKYGNKKR